MLTRSPPHLDAWTRTRELFTDWTAGCSRCDNPASRALMDVTWHGLSIWWMTNLVTKDTSVEADWFVKIHRRLARLPADQQLRRTRRPSAFLMLRQCLADIMRCLLMRAVFGRNDTARVNVWFLGLGYNLVRSGPATVVNRNFASAPKCDAAHAAIAGYLVWFMASLPRLGEMRGWQRRMRTLLCDTGRDCVVLDAHLGPMDVLSCHWAAARALMKLKKWRRTPEALALAMIDGVDCSDLVYDELEASFNGSVQQTMQFASAVGSFLKSTRSAPVVVTYGEMLGPMRAIYYRGRQGNDRTVFITVQHAMECENKLGAYHRHSEFAHAGEPQGHRYSPMPDLFLVQGAQYRAVLETFYPPERIGIIGSLKYDTWPELVRIRAETRSAVRERLKIGPRKLMVVAPSVNDDDEICSLLRGIVAVPGWLIIALPHPAMTRSGLEASLRRYGLSEGVLLPDGVTMPQLIASADLVVCGISTVAIEAAAFGVCAVRAIKSGVFPQFPEDEMIPCFSDASEFARWLAEGYDRVTADRTPADYAAVIRRYFHALDGQAAKRLWLRLAPYIQEAHP